MRAAWYAGKGGAISVETLPDPTPGAGEILIKVHRCGICGTDLSMTQGKAWDYGEGQFGHEFAGEIIALGKGVEGFALGEKLAVNPSVACGTCPACAHGNNVLCRVEGGAARGFAEYATFPASVAVKLPQTLSLDDGALVEPMAVSLYGVRMAAIPKAARVLVLGAGAVALYAIYWARRMGAGKIVALSRSARRRDLALAMGADTYLQSGEAEVSEVAEALGGPPDVVLECAGAEGMLMKAVSHVAPMGKIVSLGFCTAMDPIMPALASYKCASFQFLVGYTMADFHHVADQMDKGHVDPKLLVTSTVSLTDLPAAMDMLRGENAETKVHIAM